MTPYGLTEQLFIPPLHHFRQQVASSNSTAPLMTLHSTMALTPNTTAALSSNSAMVSTPTNTCNILSSEDRSNGPSDKSIYRDLSVSVPFLYSYDPSIGYAPQGCMIPDQGLNSDISNLNDQLNPASQSSNFGSHSFDSPSLTHLPPYSLSLMSGPAHPNTFYHRNVNFYSRLNPRDESTEMDQLSSTSASSCCQPSSLGKNSFVVDGRQSRQNSSPLITGDCSMERMKSMTEIGQPPSTESISSSIDCYCITEVPLQQKLPGTRGT